LSALLRPKRSTMTLRMSQVPIARAQLSWHLIREPVLEFPMLQAVLTCVFAAVFNMPTRIFRWSAAHFVQAKTRSR